LPREAGKGCAKKTENLADFKTNVLGMTCGSVFADGVLWSPCVTAGTSRIGPRREITFAKNHRNFRFLLRALSQPPTPQQGLQLPQAATPPRVASARSCGT